MALIEASIAFIYFPPTKMFLRILGHKITWYTTAVFNSVFELTFPKRTLFSVCRKLNKIYKRKPPAYQAWVDRFEGDLGGPCTRPDFFTFPP